MKRCKWTGNDPLLIEYHDKEWGVPLFDDDRQFEFLSLEVMQCGLSWMTVLRKREVIRKAFDAFSPKLVSQYTDEDVFRIMNTEGMIRSERKIRAVISNARHFIEIQEEHGSFSNFIWNCVDFKPVEYPDHADGTVLVSRNELSDQISKDLKKRGFSYLGSITIYSHLQAAGLINDHYDYCFRYLQLKDDMNKYLKS